MINCPNCDKQIADDSAHCGYCGHQLEEKNNKNTMFGMPALGGDELKKAVEQAKEAKNEQGENPGEAGESKKGGAFKIPKPGKGANKEDANKEGGGLKLPKPGQKQPAPDEAASDQGDQEEVSLAKTERIDLSDAQLPEDSDNDPSSDDPSSEDPSSEDQPLAVDDLGGPTEPTIGEPTVGEPTVGEPVGPPPSQASEAGAQSDQIDPAAAAPAGGPAGPTPAAQPAQAAQPTPAAQQDGWGQQEFNTTPPGQEPSEQPSANAQHQMQTQDQGEGKSKKGLIIGIVIATMVLGGGCVLTAAYFTLQYFNVF
jgi:hypothetical protein